MNKHLIHFNCLSCLSLRPRIHTLKIICRVYFLNSINQETNKYYKNCVSMCQMIGILNLKLPFCSKYNIKTCATRHKITQANKYKLILIISAK